MERKKSERDGEIDRQKERSGQSYDGKKETDRQTYRHVGLTEDLGGAERMCERPSLDEELDQKREATNLI